MINPIKQIEKQPFIPVDDWIETEEDKIFKHTKGAIILPVSRFFGVEDIMLDYFLVRSKRSYNSPPLREHLCHYLNYFLKFYDVDHQLLLTYYNIKYLIDYDPSYNREAFTYDINKYILNGPNLYHVWRMNNDNYNLNLNASNVTKNESQKYSDTHGKIFMEISILYNMIIPLLCHFIDVRKIRNIKDFLLYYIDIILSKYNDQVDIYNKLYETASSNIDRNKNSHPTLWNMQNIRAKNVTTHSLDSVTNILLQLLPKYEYSQNMVIFNYTSIATNLRYQITDIGYEYSFVGLSSSKRDGDGTTSEFDKFENHLTKADESLYIMNKVACEGTMRDIEKMYGPFSEKEIEFYKKELTKDGKSIINPFQMSLIFNLFYRYFGDPLSIKAINSDDYVKLMIAGKKILEANKMVILPYILSSRINRLVTRKNINKRELQKLENSPYYHILKRKYKNEKIEKQILNMIAIVLSSEFVIIDPDNSQINGQTMDIITDILIEDLLLYINLI